MYKIFFAVCLYGLSATAQAVPLLATTGDLGDNVIDNAGLFEVQLEAFNPSNALPSFIEVEYGIWNDPAVDVSVFVNAVLVGNFMADQGFIVPGPEYVSFDTTGLLVSGLNSIVFDGGGLNTGDYVIGQVDLHYDGNRVTSIPEPTSLALISLALTGMGFTRGWRWSA